MIEDLDGPEPAPRRRGAMRVASVFLALAALIGYAAAASPTFQGPFATPDPLAGASAVRFTPQPVASVEPASAYRPPLGCTVLGSVSNQTVFVGGRTVTVTLPRATGVPAACSNFFFPAPQPVQFERLAR